MQWETKYVERIRWKSQEGSHAAAAAASYGTGNGSVSNGADESTSGPIYHGHFELSPLPARLISCKLSESLSVGGAKAGKRLRERDQRPNV